ncbi:uncharacterized protein isoform X1 [Rhodnius prolixus]|uniref:uncharacterized protein isoform X1 n=1 Tax=Rhodnius prolixus TaxID=13249 RepID=UPI003D18C7F4
MVFMYSFCFCCSVRLGSIVVGILSLIQSSICAIIGLIWVNQTSANARKYLQTITEDVNLIFLTRLVNEIKNDPQLFSWLFTIFAVCHIITCTLEIYGSYKLAVKMIYPYLVAEMIRLVFLLAAHISGMMLIKENIFELGILIYSTLTGFFLLRNISILRLDMRTQSFTMFTTNWQAIKID